MFCDGKPLTQVSLCNGLGEKDGTYWVEANGQRVHFRLWNDEDPADHRIEVTCREQCFAPDEPFLSYIKVKGLTCAHAATGLRYRSGEQFPVTEDITGSLRTVQ